LSSGSLGDFLRVSHHTNMAGPKQIATPIGIVRILQNLSITGREDAAAQEDVKRIHTRDLYVGKKPARKSFARRL